MIVKEELHVSHFTFHQPCLSIYQTKAEGELLNELWNNCTLKCLLSGCLRYGHTCIPDTLRVGCHYDKGQSIWAIACGEMAAVPQKRKCCVLTLQTKLEIMQVLQNSNSQRLVGKKFCVAKSTVADIWKHRKKISDSTVASESTLYTKKRCIIRDTKYNLVDKACRN